MKDEWLDGLEMTSLEVEAQRLRAKHLVLPDDPERCLDAYEQYATALPDESKRKPGIKSLVKAARKSWERRDEEHLRLCIVKIEDMLPPAAIEKRYIEEQQGGGKGGSKSKRKPWAEAAASRLAAEAQGCTKAAAWEMLPDSGTEWTFELDGEYDAAVYRDGDYLTAWNDVTREPVGELKKSSFLRHYYRPDKKGQ